jgi:hypothetical protein
MGCIGRGRLEPVEASVAMSCFCFCLGGEGEGEDEGEDAKGEEMDGRS